ncbi:MAG: DNA-directed DNA polymerase [Candidatus Aenigmatarchaeota archaeon]
MRLFVLDVQQADVGRPDVLIWGKDAEGRTVLAEDRSFRPYFYVEPREGMKEKELEDLAARLSQLQSEGMRPERVEVAKKKSFGQEKDLVRMTLPRPSDVERFADMLKDWKDVKAKHEHTISFCRRYMLDRGVVPLGWMEAEGKEAAGERYGTLEVSYLRPAEGPEPKLSVLAFDIELVEEGDEEKIIMVSVKDNRGFRKVISYKKANVDFLEVVAGEKELIERLCEVVMERDPDVMVTYNGDRFDFRHLSDRAAKHGLKLAMGRTGSAASFRKRGRIYAAWVEGRIHVDLFSFVENILSGSLASESLSLDSVAREIIGMGKRKMEWEDLQRSWEESTGLEQLVKYCMRDSELTLSLAKALLPQMSELSRITGQTLFDSSRMTYSQLVEWLLIRKAGEAGELIPNRPKYEEIEIRRRATPYTGGYVYPPKEGIHRNIALLDFMSLYPSITITHNVSPETLYCQCVGGDKSGGVHKVPEEGYYYCKGHEGFVTKTVRELVEKRRAIKKEMAAMDEESDDYRLADSRQSALKVLANAIYGYYGYAGSRWYSRVCAQSITAWGRYYIHKVIGKAEKMGYEVVYGDTDSLFVKVSSGKDAKGLLDEINGTLPGAMALELQDVYPAGIFVPSKTGQTAKKRYALIDTDGEITVRGFELVRRDWSMIARETQEKVLLAILRDRSPKEALRVARKAVSAVEKEKAPIGKMVIRSQLTRPIKEYEQIGPHVVAARKSLARGRPVARGSLIAYVVTKGTGSISDRAEPAEDAQNYDPDYYVNNQVVPAAMRVLAGLGFTEDDILGGGEVQYSLDRFVKKPTVKKPVDKGKK